MAEFLRHASDEAHFEPAARNHVDGRQLFGGAQRIGTIGDGVAEHEKPRVFGDARQHREAVTTRPRLMQVAVE